VVPSRKETYRFSKLVIVSADSSRSEGSSPVAPDYVARVEFLATLADLYDRNLDSADRLDAMLTRLDHQGQHELSGLLGSHMGAMILERTGNVRHAAGYLVIACQSYAKSGSIGFAQQLFVKYPDICPVISAASTMLPESFPAPSNRSRSLVSSSRRSDSVSGISSSLDALT
jgi:hypothetical protein